MKKVLNEDFGDSPGESDIKELSEIYNKTFELQEFVSQTAFENSPIIYHTYKILEYCKAQKKGIEDSI